MCRYWKVSVGLEKTVVSREPFRWRVILMSRKWTDLWEISWVNLMVGWKLLAWRINSRIMGCGAEKIANMSSMNLFQNMGRV